MTFIQQIAGQLHLILAIQEIVVTQKQEAPYIQQNFLFGV